MPRGAWFVSRNVGPPGPPLNGHPVMRLSSPGIVLTQIWSDDDTVELRAEASDGTSAFTCQTYVGHQRLADDARSLDAFRHHVHGSVLDLCFGAFGPEFAGGAFHARLHFAKPGRLFVSVHQQSGFAPFALGDRASEARLHFTSEPDQLDRFVSDLRGLSEGRVDSATLAGA